MNPGEEKRRRRRRDVFVCLCVALVIATAFSAWVLALYLFRGNTPFERLGTTVGAVMILYFSAAILVGPFVGLLLPLARAGRGGAALVGTVAAIPIYGIAVVTLEGVTPWTLAKTLGMLIPALLVGPTVGLAYRRIFHDGL